MTIKRAKRLYEFGKGEFLTVRGVQGSELLFHHFGRGTYGVKSYKRANSADLAKARLA